MGASANEQYSSSCSKALRAAMGFSFSTGGGKPLLLTLHQPASPGFELRIYYCASCAASDRVIAPRAAAAQGFRRSPNLC
jgi:hypothetical protein